jgi:hypothetical protein
VPYGWYIRSSGGEDILSPGVREQTKTASESYGEAAQHDQLSQGVIFHKIETKDGAD